jgi:hypothetical protein
MRAVRRFMVRVVGRSVMCMTPMVATPAVQPNEVAEFGRERPDDASERVTIPHRDMSVWARGHGPAEMLHQGCLLVEDELVQIVHLSAEAIELFVLALERISRRAIVGV